MMVAPNGIVLGPGRVKLWWSHVLDWIEGKLAPQVIASRKRLPSQEAEVTRLERLIDQLWP